ncbi:autophagy protein Apg5-domain-containing protein [Dissophora ornata]|nr:autophagy protein Apg5-domain-containing protein [Dissophora ornata]
MTPRPATTTSNAPHNPIARVIWEGSIPIQLSWDLAEVTGYSLKHIEPLLIEAPRCSYLPILTGQARNHISARHAQLTSDDSEVWYEYEGIPLKWHYPIGLLYDIHVLQAEAVQGAGGVQPLPWKVTMHFEDFPSDKLIKSLSSDSCQDYFMSMIKEADYLRNGTTKKVMNMSKSDQTQLWDGLWSNSYDLFWGMNQKLVLNDGTIARNLPIRIYLPENCPVVQEPVSPMDEQDQPRTLRQILNIALPDLFPLESSDSRQDAASVMIHGITPSLDVNALWFAQNMAYPDNFLHLVIVFSKFP